MITDWPISSELYADFMKVSYTVSILYVFELEFGWLD